VKVPERRIILRWAFKQIANCISSVLGHLSWQFIGGWLENAFQFFATCALMFMTVKGADE
jgi:hypothetical protein